MSNANEVALMHKWSVNEQDANTTTTTTTKKVENSVCCCNNNQQQQQQQRRRPLKSTTATTAKNRKANILIENDFCYIDDDDETIVINRSSSNSHNISGDCYLRAGSGSSVANGNGKPPKPPLAIKVSSSSSSSALTAATATALTSPPRLTVDAKSANDRRKRRSRSCETKQTGNCNCHSREEYLMIGKTAKDQDDAGNGVGDDESTSPSPRTTTAARRISEQWRHDSRTHHNNNRNSCAATTIDPNSQSQQLTIENNCNGKICCCCCSSNSSSSSSSVTKDTNTGNDSGSRHRQHQHQHQLQQTQRLSNNIINNKENISSVLSCSRCPPESSPSLPSSPSQFGSVVGNKSYNYCQRSETNNGTDTSNGNDHKNKMTITTTTISSRKRSSPSVVASGGAGRSASPGGTPGTAAASSTECGMQFLSLAQLSSSTPSSTTTTAATVTTPKSPTAVTTVITTTMVKRSDHEGDAGYSFSRRFGNKREEVTTCGNSIGNEHAEFQQQKERLKQTTATPTHDSYNDNEENHDSRVNSNSSSQCNKDNDGDDDNNIMTINCSRISCNNHSNNNDTCKSAILMQHHHQGQLRPASPSTLLLTKASVSPSPSSSSSASTGHEVLAEKANKPGGLITTGMTTGCKNNKNNASRSGRCDNVVVRATRSAPIGATSVDFKVDVGIGAGAGDGAGVAAETTTSTGGGGTIANCPVAQSSSTIAANDRKFHSLKSNLAASVVSGDKKFLLSCNNDGGKVTRHSSQDLENMAVLPLDVGDGTNDNDDDGDPYFALQEYLERVKHEINEVFEQYQQAQRTSESETAETTTTTSAATNDELARCTKSDSGGNLQISNNNYNSYNQNNNKLPSQEMPCRVNGKTCGTATDDTAAVIKLNEIRSRNSQKDINGHDHSAETTVIAASMPTNVSSSSTNGNSKSQKRELLSQLQVESGVKASTGVETFTATNGYDETTPTNVSTSPLLPSPSPSPTTPSPSSRNDQIKQHQQQQQCPVAVSPLTPPSTLSSAASTSSTLKRLRKQLTASCSPSPSHTAASTSCDPDDVNIWANKFLRDLDNLMASDKSASPPPRCGGKLVIERDHHLHSVCGGGAVGVGAAGVTVAAGISSNSNSSILRPEKHATIPLQSFNLDCRRLDGSTGAAAKSANPNPIGYLMRTLSAPSAATPYNDNGGGGGNSHKISSSGCGGGGGISIPNNRCLASSLNSDYNRCMGNFHGLFAKRGSGSCGAAGTQETAAAETVLKIEENDAIQRSLLMNASSANGEEHQRQQQQQQQRRQRQLQLESDMETIRTTLLSQNHQLASIAAAAAALPPPPVTPKRERIHHTATATTTGYLLNSGGGGGGGSGDSTKKGSTSTIWTSEESILRSVGAVDEDNNSTSSSACEEASGVLSSGKSGISLDSSGLDNDNNESGIGTATPPKDVSFWKNVPDNESLTSLDALRKMKFQKGSSVASSDDPDLLEVLSLYDEPHDDDDEAADVDVDDDEDVDIDEDDNDVEDEGHDEFETAVTYYDYECTDGDGSSGGSGDATSRVVLRKKLNLAPASPATTMVVVPKSRAQKFRSHSLESASLHPTTLQFDQLHQQQNVQHNNHHHHHLHQHHYQQNYKSHHHQLTRQLQHLKTKDKALLSLALRQEPFQSILPPTNFHELPSPSSASLHSGHESLGMQELTTKSNSAPLLLKKEKKRDDFGGQKLTLRYSRSQSDRYLAEIEAVEACKWLRAAGFPQYAQMYEDSQFPLDLTSVAKDHTNLENDQLQSLYRRLCILNRCANMRLDSAHKTQTPQKEDSDDENFALSENWTFQPHIRRWSRIGEMGLELPTKLTGADKTESSSKESSPDRFEDDTYDISAGAGLSLTLPLDSTDSTQTDPSNDPAAAVRLRRTGSERIKDGAKALLRRVESIKSRRRKRQNREGIVISGPQALDLSQLGQRSSFRKPDGVYSTPPSPSAVSPMHYYPKSPLFGHELKVPSQSENFLSPNRNSPKRTPTTPRSMRASPLHFFTTPMPHLSEGRSDDSSSYYSDSQESSAGGKLSLSLRKTPLKTRRFLQRTGKVDDIGTHSDSECHQGRKFIFKNANSHTAEMKVKKLTRGGSLNLGKDSKKHREGFRSSSFRARTVARKDARKTSESDAENIKVSKSPVVRWHSFQDEERPHMVFRKCHPHRLEVDKATAEGTAFAAMSCGQLQIIRKLALVILTGHMERYCPTHRSGWNWELPKFIKKIKMPDYKDKKVFGVPLLLILQRTGQTLPIAVRAAFRWLQLNALDQIGLFRKSGVKSRIFKLKERIEFAESSTECMDVFDTQQAYDVADMLKQYFRDLPESLLTTKMSDTFAAIFQHLPPDVRLDAVQCAVLLLPDENREILYALLEFLTLVAANSSYNQMTANNLAVCLAPSLFHNNIPTGSSSVSASPRRRKTPGVPDVKELSEAKASHECLAFMIENYKKIYTASREKIAKCNFGYMEDSKPVPLEALGEGMQFHNWRGYLYECTSATIKEGREKSRGWFTTASLDASVEIAYKKVGDGHPLRLWRCITEVEGPPKDVLDYIIKQRASWDVNLLQSQTVKKLDERTEIFQYAFDGQIPTDFCVLRSWQTDLPRGACVIVETSVDHLKATAMFGSIRGVVLASRYLIEPSGSGRSRVMHLARVDIKGKTPEWYNKSYGHICSHYLAKIRMAFRHVAEGPESKV